MSTRKQAQVAQSIDRRTVPTIVLFGAAALIWLAGVGSAKAEAETASGAPGAGESASAAASLSQLLSLHRQAAASSGAVVTPHASGPCCAHAAAEK